MSYAYILHKHAQLDYEQSLEWYMERSVVAAEKFVAAIDNALQLICDNPTRWRNKYKNFHEISLKKYPFTIIYTTEADNAIVVVSSIYHHKRKPKGKYRKI
jgi:plasmid stabilization system protein ParE